ncbi:hypothetical protein ABIB94_009363, partial [Bradyrhizobium sp. JR7.2]
MSVPDTAGPRCFCRDCLADLDMRVRRCSACGSPRLVRHRALAGLTIAHIDCDAFGGFKRSSQHQLFSLITAIRQAPPPAFSSLVS